MVYHSNWFFIFDLNFVQCLLMHKFNGEEFFVQTGRRLCWVSCKTKQLNLFNYTRHLLYSSTISCFGFNFTLTVYNIYSTQYTVRVYLICAPTTTHHYPAVSRSHPPLPTTTHHIFDNYPPLPITTHNYRPYPPLSTTTQPFPAPTNSYPPLPTTYLITTHHYPSLPTTSRPF